MLVTPHVSSAARSQPRPQHRPQPLLLPLSRSQPGHGPAGPGLRTHEGGPAFVREPREELFLLAVGNFVSQRTFYESGEERDDRYIRLVGELAVQDPVWTAGLLRWLRGEGNMRTASQAAASIGPWSQPASASHVMPAPASRSGPPGPVSSARRSSTAESINARWAVSSRSEAGGTARPGW